ncbi:MAG: NAD(P)-binding domain-containing protein [Ardenticatenaceae bacterium]|nr:NAD(P)-binding domain-containing protein [Ardenticatenaceae bacterium]
MKISIIGAGNIGGTLGGKWATQGHQVVFGVRDPQAGKVQILLESHGTTAHSINKSITEAEVVVFAIPGGAMAETVGRLGDNLNGKILIDATNHVGQQQMHQLPLLRQAAPESAIFRAFSTLGWENFADPVIGGQQVDLFYCGDSGSGQEMVNDLIADIGLRPIYIGGLDQVDIIDSLARLWFVMALQQGRGRHLAFKLQTGLMTQA